MDTISIIGLLVAVGAVLLAYRVGFSSGFIAGRDAGFDDGRKEGSREGSMRGYAVGYDRGKRASGDGDDGGDSRVPGFVVLVLLVLTVLVVYWFAMHSRRAARNQELPLEMRPALEIVQPHVQDTVKRSDAQAVV